MSIYFTLGYVAHRRELKERHMMRFQGFIFDRTLRPVQKGKTHWQCWKIRLFPFGIISF